LEQIWDGVGAHYAFVACAFVSPFAHLSGHVFHVCKHVVCRVIGTYDAEEKAFLGASKVSVSEASSDASGLHRLILSNTHYKIYGVHVMLGWVPRDGDTFITRDNFVFYTFGYEHPRSRVIAFLKYIPAQHRELFKIRFLKRTWRKGKLQLLRAEKLYTAENYATFLEVFRQNFPDYVFHCPFRQKDLISVPLKQIKKVYPPNECLQALLRKKRKDKLEKVIVRLLSLLSKKSRVPMSDFGLHGSLALNMHTVDSDVDFVVYGGNSFRRVENAVERLVKRNVLSFVFTKRLDMVRHYRGRFKDTLFVYNAVRKPQEIKAKYGAFRYSPVRPVKFYCQVNDDREAMFRPAVYSVEDYVPIDKESILAEETSPDRVVSMIGYYRNVARKNDRVRVSGVLECVENVKTGKTSFQVVVGTATSEDEYIWPL
jgi:predicted nucleotidyltransferase